MLKKITAVVLAMLMLLPVCALGASADEVSRVVCTMYKDGATGRGFNWFTSEKGNSDLQLVPTADFDGSFDGAKAYTGSCSYYRQRWAHKVYVSDLEAGTAYTYRVGDMAKNIWSDACSFVTDDGDTAFSFVTIADVQASSDENFAQAARVLKSALEICPDAEFTANLGDYVNDNTNDEWDWYFKNFAFANNSCTHVPVAGNHDGNITNKLNTCCFRNTFALDESQNESIEGVYYSFDYGDAHFAVLNSNDMYPMSQAQRNWLANDMRNSDATWKIVLAHRSFYSAGKNINKPDTIIMRNELLPLMDKLDIDVMYAGHDHMYMRTKQVYGDKAVEDVTVVSEEFRGENTDFAVNPEGTVYILPSTAGTKRYNVNEDAISPILDVAAVTFSTKDLGGCFCVTEIDGGRLVYKAYIVDDETGETTLVDYYAIKKDEGGKAVESSLIQNFGITVAAGLLNFMKAIFGMLKSYIGMLFK